MKGFSNGVSYAYPQSRRCKANVVVLYQAYYPTPTHTHITVKITISYFIHPLILSDQHAHSGKPEPNESFN